MMKIYQEYKLTWLAAIIIPILIVVMNQVFIDAYILLFDLTEYIDILPAASAVQVMMYVLAIYFVFWRRGFRFPLQLNEGVRPINILGLAFGLSLVVCLALAPILNLIPTDADLIESFDALLQIPWLAITMTVVIAPVFEELIFRGIILGGLSHKYGKILPLVFSSLLFGAFHLNLHQFISASIVGVFCGLVFLWTASLRYSIMFHALYNILVSSTSYFLLFLDLNLVWTVLFIMFGVLFIAIQLSLLNTSCR